MTVQERPDRSQSNSGFSEPGSWYLEGFFDDRALMRRVVVRPLPFVIGRTSQSSLILNYRNISRVHAELSEVDGKLFVRDLDSTNGTFLNGKQVLDPQELKAGDIVHFAECEFRIGREKEEQVFGTSSTQDISQRVTRGLLSTMKDFNDLLETEAVFPVFQPIVEIESRSRIAYEALGRGKFPGLSRMPRDLFSVASLVCMESRLSRLFLKKAVEVAADYRLCSDVPLFFNIHPSEMYDIAGLTAWLREAFDGAPEIGAKMEVSEAAVTSVREMEFLHNELKELGLGLVYDDFGSGQARLLELTEVPPDYVKFDITLVKDLHTAGKKRQEMIELLVRLATELGVQCIAEGVETAEEAEACQQAGFKLAQGYFFGYPFPLSQPNETYSQTDT